MPTEVFRHIVGVMPNGDNLDQSHTFLLDAQNIDWEETPGQFTVRRALQIVDTENVPNLDNLWQIHEWQSGIGTIVYNRLLIYRAANGEQWDYSFMTNAPTGGGLESSFIDLHGTFTAKTCQVNVRGGTLTIQLGNQQPYMILKNLCPEGERGYPGLWYIRSTDPPVNIEEDATWTGFSDPVLDNDANGDLLHKALRVRSFGQGGYVYAGWLWDYGSLYTLKGVEEDLLNGITGALPTSGFLQEWTTTIFWTILPETTVDGEVPLDPGVYEYMAALIYDTDPEQIGHQLVTENFIVQGSGYAITGASPAVHELTFHFRAGEDVNRRITGIAVYARQGDQVDFARIATVPFDETWIDLSGTTDPIGGTLGYRLNETSYYKKLRVDQSMLDSSVNYGWTTESGGRPIRNTIVPLSDFDLATTTIDNEGDIFDAPWSEFATSIDVYATGIRTFKGISYAWGVDGDDTQSRVYYSAFGASLGMPDVWLPAVRFFYDEFSNPVTWITPFNDLLVVFGEIDLYMVDTSSGTPQALDRIGNRPKIGTTYTQTIYEGINGVIFCNKNSIYLATYGGQVEDIAIGKVLSIWESLDSDEKAAAICGYHRNRREFWVHMADRTWRYRLESGQWHSPYKWPDVFTLSGFYEQKSDGELVLYGTHVELSLVIAKLGQKSGLDFQPVV